MASLTALEVLSEVKPGEEITCVTDTELYGKHFVRLEDGTFVDLTTKQTVNVDNDFLSSRFKAVEKGEQIDGKTVEKTDLITALVDFEKGKNVWVEFPDTEGEMIKEPLTSFTKLGLLENKLDDAPLPDSLKCSFKEFVMNEAMEELSRLDGVIPMNAVLYGKFFVEK